MDTWFSVPAAALTLTDSGQLTLVGRGTSRCDGEKGGKHTGDEDDAKEPDVSCLRP